MTNEVLNILLFSNFFQKCVMFWENAKKPFLGPKFFLKERRRPATKMNITFLKGNEVLNIFSYNNFFERSNIFGENGEKILGGHDHFLGEGVILAQKWI